jgi:hypothetical protein
MIIRARLTMTVPCTDLTSGPVDVMVGTIFGADIGAM